MIRYYNGNYTLKIGHPMVILTIKEDDESFIAEEFIFFESSNGIEFIANRTSHNKIQNQTKDDFIELELEIIRSIIYNEIILKKLINQKNDIIPEIKINLKKSNQSLLSLLRYKSEKHLKIVLEKTTNEKLKELIKLNLSILVTREKL